MAGQSGGVDSVDLRMLASQARQAQASRVTQLIWAGLAGIVEPAGA